VTSARRPDLGTVGDRNHAYVTARPYTHIVVEVDSEGVGPELTTIAIQGLVRELAARVQKPGGIVVAIDPPFAATGVETWTPVELAEHEARVRDHYDGPNVATIHVTAVAGRNRDDPDVIGFALAGSSIAVFEGRLATAVARSAVETALLVHEAGHLLGLVDLTTPMVEPHESAEKPVHDVSRDCVMYWQIALVGTSLPHEYCARCVDDLRAIGGR
jgi:hypothetical protein